MVDDAEGSPQQETPDSVDIQTPRGVLAAVVVPTTNTNDSDNSTKNNDSLIRRALIVMLTVPVVLAPLLVRTPKTSDAKGLSCHF